MSGNIGTQDWGRTMSRKEIFSRTRGRLLPTIFLTYFMFITLAIIVAIGFILNHALPSVSKGNILALVGVCPGVLILGIVWNWKYSLDLLFKSTEIFSGHVTLGQQIFGSKVESCEGGQWELLEKSRDNAFRKFKIYSDRMGLIYPANKLPDDLCAGPVIFRYMKRSKYIVEIIQIEKD